MAYKFGLKWSPPGAVKLKLKNYVDIPALPPVPASYGHEKTVTAWGMLGNDRVGDCVFAGGAHEHLVYAGANSRPLPDFTDVSVLSDYSALTGYDPAQTDPDTGENPTDQGTDMATAAAYRKSTGLIDAAGVRHKIGAYLALDPGNLDELYAASYLFGAVGIGVVITQAQMDQTGSGKPWSYKRNSPELGGHYVPVVARRKNYPIVVTWGQLQLITPAFYEKQSNEAIAYISDEYLTGGVSPEGFDKAALLADLARI